MKTNIPRKISNDWYLWLFPVIAIVITGWLMFDFYQQHGPTIKVTFDDAGGMQAEKTKLKYRGVPIGTVTDVAISEDLKTVVATIILRKDAKNFAVEGSKFSLVAPRVGLSGVTGIDALFDGGSYIEVLPGLIGGEAKTDFRAVANRNATETRDDTSAYILEAANVESINVGNSVTFRGFKVGTIANISLGKDSRALNIVVNIENKYTKLIRTNTQFWRKVGVQAKVGLLGAEVKVNSMDTIMNGGIEFATPDEVQPMAKAGHRFVYLAAPPKGYEKWNPKLEFPTRVE